MDYDKRLRMIEQRIAALESRPIAGRPTIRLEEAKEYLRKILKRNRTVAEIMNCNFNRALLTKARKELGYDSWVQDGVWYWGQHENKM